MNPHAHVALSELEVGFEAVVAFTEICRFVTNDELRRQAVALASDAETLLKAATDMVADKRERETSQTVTAS